MATLTRRRPGTRLWQAVLRARRGVAATEFAIIVPGLLLMMVGAYDYGMSSWHKLQVANGVRAGAAYAVQHGFNEGAISAAITGASNYPALLAVPAPAQICGCPNVVSGIVAASCGGTCSGGIAAGTYVRVGASSTYVFAFHLPGRPSSMSLLSTGIARIE